MKHWDTARYDALKSPLDTETSAEVSIYVCVCPLEEYTIPISRKEISKPFKKESREILVKNSFRSI